MNHIFLFQVHKEPELVRRIFQRLEASNHYFIVNIDKKSPYRHELCTIVNRVNNVISITDNSIAHGGFSFTECTINQMKVCRDYSVYFDYYHTCSGQDYPCVSNKKFDSFFDDSFGFSYFKMDDPEEVEQKRKTKYKDRMESLDYSDLVKGRFIDRTPLNRIIRRIITPIKREYPALDLLWGGWNWFSLTDKCVDYLLKYFSENPEYVERFKYTFAPDELIFSTVLYYVRNELKIEIANSLRYVDWTPTREYSGLPLLLDERDYNEIIQSGALFCRKVEGEYSRVLLDMLDKHSSLM